MTEDYLPLHLKYRPKTFDDFVGNKAMVNSLRTVLSKPAKPHAYLLSGEKGCGKTSMARIIASALGCSSRDFHEMNSASYRGIDMVRELYQNASRRPWDGSVSVYLMDEIHSVTKEGQNALLKLLEEPPRHAYFILATTDPDKLLGTIRSRCAHYPVQPLPRDLVVDRLIHVCDEEGYPETHPTDKVLTEIARQCDGSLRQALMILDQIIDIDNEDKALEAVFEAAGDDRQAIELCRALVKGQSWPYVQGLLRDLGEEPESVRRSILGYFNSIMLKNANARVFEIVESFLPSVMYSGKAGLTLACYKVVQQNELRQSKVRSKQPVA